MVVRMLADPVRHGFEAALGVPPSPELLSTLSARQAAGDARTELPVELRADSHPLDLLTIEFVTLIFGALLSDDTIDAALRAEVGRLQVVAIKAALLDRTFFANRRHPMRRLLDQVSMLAIDVEIDVRTGSTYQLGLRAIIDELMRDFDTDLSVFPVAMQALDALHQRCRAPAIQAISSATTEIESAEHRERIQTTCLAEVRRRAGPRAPLEIRTFLETWWVQVLAECYGNTAPDTLCWQHRLAVADQLVWSVSSLGSAEVTRLALTLPTIMRDLRQGMDAVAMPLPEREDFFVKLMALHTHTIQRAKARAVTASEISLIPAEFTPAPPPVTQPRVAPLPANLRVGVVVELMMKGRATPMKLVWISSSRKTYVFSSQSQHAHAVPALALGDALAAGRARIVSKNEPLIDRLIQKLTHA